MPTATTHSDDPNDPPRHEAPPFDFRRVRIEPDAHLGEPRVCDVRFADASHALEPRERSLYPDSTAAHRTVRCDSDRGEAWLEVIFSDAGDAPNVVTGRRVVLVPEETSGGRHDYVLARYERLLGDAPAREETAEARPETGASYDFRALPTEPRPVGLIRDCFVDFVSEIHALESERRRRLGYPEGVVNRLDIKCLHQGGDSWIDLVFDAESAERALEVAPGASISVEVLRASGGFADRPITRLAGS